MQEHRGYRARIEHHAADRVYHGRVVGIRDVVTFEGETPESAAASFREAVDDYLAQCREEGREPDRPSLTPDRRAMLDDPDAVGDDIAGFLNLDATDREVIRLRGHLSRSVRWAQQEHGLSDRQVYERLRLIEMGRVDATDRAPYDLILAAYLAIGGDAHDFGGWTPADDYRRPVRQPRSLPALRRPAGIAWKKYRG